MKVLWRIILLVLLILIIVPFTGYLPGDKARVVNYDKNLFYPYQTLRGIILGSVPFSVGDILYLAAGIAIVSMFARWLYVLIKVGHTMEEISVSALNVVNTVVIIYLIFILSWGANYYKPSLAVSWGLEDPPHVGLRLKSDSSSIDAELVKEPVSPATKRARDSAALMVFDTFLIHRLNTLAPQYTALTFDAINDQAKALYMQYTNSKVKEHGLQIKPTIFGWFMETFAVEGYYNPFTGEGQVNNHLPAYTLPFIVCHEMAHQAGIAAEGDANLMSYTLCTTSIDPSFNYSAYLDIWLYTHNRVYRFDSSRARRNEAQLNKLTKAHLDTLEQISHKYHDRMAQYSSEIYDSYLKMQDQKNGIRSYGDVAVNAWKVEQRRKKGTEGLIIVP